MVAFSAFKMENLVKILVSNPEILFTSPIRNGLPSPRFNSWWLDIKERVTNFVESDAQRVDVPPIFQGDFTLKPFSNAKRSSIKRKKNANTPSSKKLKVYYFLYNDCLITSSFIPGLK